MNDLIDRQAAIDAVDEALARIFVEHRDIAEKMINKMPSAQPEIIRCKDCKYWDGFSKGHFWYAEYCSLHQCAERSDDFCSQAERREE